MFGNAPRRERLRQGFGGVGRRHEIGADARILQRLRRVRADGGELFPCERPAVHAAPLRLCKEEADAHGRGEYQPLEGGQARKQPLLHTGDEAQGDAPFRGHAPLRQGGAHPADVFCRARDQDGREEMAAKKERQGAHLPHHQHEGGGKGGEGFQFA